MLYDGTGRPVTALRELGRGGEGAVFDVANDADHVAKVYHQPAGGEQADKLTALTRVAGPALLAVAAWPVATLHDRPGGQVRGLLMPKVIGHREAHQLYSP